MVGRETGLLRRGERGAGEAEGREAGERTRSGGGAFWEGEGAPRGLERYCQHVLWEAWDI